MASNPVLISITKETWTKVASAVKTGLIIIKEVDSIYFSTYRVAGDPAPVAADLELEAQKMRQPGAKISADTDIDVYIWCARIDGRVRVDL